MMRQQLLHGYVLHQRAYREKSRLVHFFSLESGRIDGVARQHLPPLYQPALLYASGKTSLKTFTKIEQVGNVYSLTGQALFAGFYLNELLVRLLPLEESCPELFASYGWALESLMAFGRQTDAVQAKRELLLILRRFEQVLLDTLGYTPRFDLDADGQLIAGHAGLFALTMLGDAVGIDVDQLYDPIAVGPAGRGKKVGDHISGDRCVVS